MKEAITVAALARRTGIPVRTIRYWEQRGLLPKAARSHTGYRLFGPETVHYVDFVRKAKNLGFTLAETKAVLDLSRTGRNPCPEVKHWVEQKMAAVEQQIRFLSMLRRRLKTASQTWSRDSGRSCYRPAELCCLIEDLQLPTTNRGGNPNEKTVRTVARSPRRTFS